MKSTVQYAALAAVSAKSSTVGLISIIAGLAAGCLAILLAYRVTFGLVIIAMVMFMAVPTALAVGCTFGVIGMFRHPNNRMPALIGLTINGVVIAAVIFICYHASNS